MAVTPPAHPIEKSEAVSQVFGSDPWLRFDLWATRAWEAAEKAAAMAQSLGAPTGSEDNIDPRVVTLFHAASVAKDFAEMVNPADALGGRPGLSIDSSEAVLAMIMDSED